MLDSEGAEGVKSYKGRPLRLEPRTPPGPKRVLSPFNQKEVELPTATTLWAPTVRQQTQPNMQYGRARHTNVSRQGTPMRRPGTKRKGAARSAQ